MWGHDHKNIKTDLDHTLAEDHNTFEMHKMMVRTDQLLQITEATVSKIYSRDSEAKANGRAKTLLLKQYHAQLFSFLWKGNN